ncbi:MAG: hypothetical protein ACK50A_07780 [Sphingobacteriaceae bacterium]
MDNRNVQQENDAAVSEINTEVGNVPNLHGRGASANGINALHSALGITATGYTVNLADTANGSITITYNGTVVNNRKREGSIKLTILDFANGKRWKQVGCVVQVEYMDYKITRASDGKFVKLNGIQNLTNITGGTWWELLIIKTQTSLATSVTGTDLNVTFEDGKTAVYNINRKFTYTLPGGILTCTGEGIGSKDALSSLENYGTTRDGDAFTSQVTTPIVWNWTFGWWAPTQGAVEVKVASKEFSLKCTFAVDKDGNPVSVASNTCAYGWKVEWKYKNKERK